MLCDLTTAQNILMYDHGYFAQKIAAQYNVVKVQNQLVFLSSLLSYVKDAIIYGFLLNC